MDIALQGEAPHSQIGSLGPQPEATKCVCAGDLRAQKLKQKRKALSAEQVCNIFNSKGQLRHQLGC